MLVTVKDGDIAKALKVLKYKMQRQGIFKEMKLRRHYEKPSDARRRQRQEAARRAQRARRKRAIAIGEVPAPIKRKAAKP